MEFPNWATEIFKQFPVVAICGLVLWRAAKYFDGRQKAELQALQSQHELHHRTVTDMAARHVEDLKAQHARQVESMQREIDRLVNSLREATKERERLLRRLVPDDKKE